MNSLAKYFTILLTFSVCSYFTTAESAIEFSPSSLTLEIGKEYDLKVRLKESYNFTVFVNFTYGDENEVKNVSNGIIDQLPQVEFEANSNESKVVKLHAKEVGHLVIGAISDNIKIPLSDVFRIDVVHSSALNVFIFIVGWVYFAAWSISFYPQVILNIQRKSVEGLNFDFLFLNFLGHSCYLVFNTCLYWSPAVQSEYFKIHPRGVNPVLLNDVLFSMHAVLLTFITIVQCFIYHRANQKVSKIAIGIMTVLILFLVICGFILLANKIDGLQYAYFFSYVKLSITLMKYFPQAYMNYKRKSTEGWSIVNILLDFTGGSLSLIQMFFLAYNFNDWSSIFGSPTKFGLGFFSIIFDIVFIVQHYVLYRNNSPYSTIGGNDEPTIQA